MGSTWTEEIFEHPMVPPNIVQRSSRTYAATTRSVRIYTKWAMWKTLLQSRKFKQDTSQVDEMSWLANSRLSNKRSVPRVLQRAVHLVVALVEVGHLVPVERPPTLFFHPHHSMSQRSRVHLWCLHLKGRRAQRRSLRQLPSQPLQRPIAYQPLPACQCQLVSVVQHRSGLFPSQHRLVR
jgi:hypothetical protein